MSKIDDDAPLYWIARDCEPCEVEGCKESAEIACKHCGKEVCSTHSRWLVNDILCASCAAPILAKRGITITG